MVHGIRGVSRSVVSNGVHSQERHRVRYAVPPLTRVAVGRMRSRTPPSVCVSAAAAPPPAVAPESVDFFGRGILRMLSGGSLEETFMSLSIHQAAKETVLTLALLYLTVRFGQGIATFVNRQLSSMLYAVFQSQDISSDDERVQETRTKRNVLLGFLDSIRRPLEVLIPVYGATFGLTVLLTFAKVCIQKSHMAPHGQLFRSLSNAGTHILSQAIYLLSESSELVLILFVAWSFLNMKDKALLSISRMVQETSFDQNEVSRFLQPFSQLLTWAIALATLLSCLLVLGIDVGPMLAVGSVSTIAIGFAAQSTVGNIVAALSLYTSRTFIAGDRVQFKSMGGSTVVSGTVQDIKPLKTLVKCDNGSLVYVNNKDLATSLMVVNESEQSKSKLSSSIPVIEDEIIIQYKDVDKVDAIVKQIDEYLKHHQDLDKGLSRRCCVVGFCVDGVKVQLKGTLAVHARSKRGQVYTDIYLTAERIVRKNGAFLSQTLGYELPPALE
ncbi:hypothetical protein M9435_001563 [Picochlorum sp. BPE23]|nr:hypothetical protein M9435_001563 [Picochlorum sp. BPE23]